MIVRDSPILDGLPSEVVALTARLALNSFWLLPVVIHRSSCAFWRVSLAPNSLRAAEKSIKINLVTTCPVLIILLSSRTYQVISRYFQLLSKFVERIALGAWWIRIFRYFGEEPRRFVHSQFTNVHVWFDAVDRSSLAEGGHVQHPTTAHDQFNWNHLV